MRAKKGLAFNAYATDDIAGFYDFDPIGIATNLPVTDRFELQEAEIINGRLAMLALMAMVYVEAVLGIPLSQFSPF